MAADQVGTADGAKPLAAQVTLHTVLVRVVSDLTERSEVRRPIAQAPQGPRSRVVPATGIHHLASPDPAPIIGKA